MGQGERPVAGQHRLADGDPQFVNPPFKRLNSLSHRPDDTLASLAFPATSSMNGDRGSCAAGNGLLPAIVRGRLGGDVDLPKRRSLGAPNRIPWTSACIGVAATPPRVSGEIS
jgi:hypothetical protein